MLKRIKIEAYQVGLVFQNRKLIEVLNEGKHWVFGDKNVMIYEMKQTFVPLVELNILLQNETLAAMLEIVEVGDNEIALYFVNGIFNEVLTTGRYAFWKGYVENKFIKADLSKVQITEQIAMTLLENPKVKLYTRKFQVLSNEKALLFINGAFVKELTAGTYYFWNNTIPVEVKAVDE